jgi:hypothetical protein
LAGATITAHCNRPAPPNRSAPGLTSAFSKTRTRGLRCHRRVHTQTHNSARHLMSPSCARRTHRPPCSAHPGTLRPLPKARLRRPWQNTACGERSRNQRGTAMAARVAVDGKSVSLPVAIRRRNPPPWILHLWVSNWPETRNKMNQFRRYPLLSRRDDDVLSVTSSASTPDAIRSCVQ